MSTELQTREHEQVAHAWGLLQAKQAAIEELKKADLPVGSALTPERLQAGIAVGEADAVDGILHTILGGLPEPEALEYQAVAEAEQARSAEVAELRAKAAQADTATKKKDLSAQADEVEATAVKPGRSAGTPRDYETQVSLEEFEILLGDPLDALDARLASFMVLCHSEIAGAWRTFGIEEEIQGWKEPIIGIAYHPVKDQFAAELQPVYSADVFTRDDGGNRGYVAPPGRATAGGWMPTDNSQRIVFLRLDEGKKTWTPPADERREEIRRVQREMRYAEGLAMPG